MKRSITIFCGLTLLFCTVGTMPLSAQSFFADMGRAVSNLFAPRIEGSGKVLQETRSLETFHTVRVDAPFGVDIDCAEQGQSSAFVQADDNILPLISTTVRNGVLTVSLSNEVSANGLRSKNLKVVIAAPATERVELLGAGSVAMTHINRPTFIMELHGVGSMEASGKVENLVVEGHGVGSISAKHVKAQNVKVSSHGVGSTSVYAASSLDIDLGGIGSLVYYGNPANIRKNASGIGSVSKGSSSFQP
jgi:hypothetical protein